MKELFDNPVLQLTRAALWEKELPELVVRETYEEMQAHAISSLIAPIFSSISLDIDIQKQWKENIICHIYQYNKYMHEQLLLHITVPYVILKGTAAAQYYPDPSLRAMGDIDIMTCHDDLVEACIQLEKNGYVKTKESNREIVYSHGEMIIELHQRFASLNDPEQAEYMDSIIIDNITPCHLLPDLVNGLVLLEHISQHLEHGLGLRQIIDWMMFVNKCLPDEKWLAFKQMSDRIGLTKLAVVVTRICELYLGLPTREWSAEADTKLCKQLLEYVLSCGDFGNKRTSKTALSEDVLAHASTLKMAFTILQKQGMINWKLAHKYAILRPFAWIFQLIRYISKGLKRKNAITKLSAEYHAAKKRNAMIESLGVKMTAKGIAKYINGKYVKG